MKKFVALVGAMVVGGSLGPVLAGCGSDGVRRRRRNPHEPTRRSPHQLARIRTRTRTRSRGKGAPLPNLPATAATSAMSERPTAVPAAHHQLRHRSVLLRADVQKAAEKDGRSLPASQSRTTTTSAIRKRRVRLLCARVGRAGDRSLARELPDGRLSHETPEQCDKCEPEG